MSNLSYTCAKLKQRKKKEEKKQREIEKMCKFLHWQKDQEHLINMMYSLGPPYSLTH